MLKVKKGLLCFLILIVVLSSSFAGAEIKVFEKETIWKAVNSQTQEQAEGLAKLEAQRQAIEEASAFFPSLDIMKNYKLEKDKVTQMAFGILKTKTVGEPRFSIDNGILCIRIKTVIHVDTAVISRQIETLMKDEGALKREEDDMKKVREIQEQLTNLKSSEGERIREINARALLMKRDKDRLRLSLEEQAFKSKGEPNPAASIRFVKEREMEDRVSQIEDEQEKEKRAEAVALAAEQDHNRRIFLENKHRMNDLFRRARISRESWGAIDDSLTLNQAMEEVKRVKAEIAGFRNRLDFQYATNIANIKDAYAPKQSLKTVKLPAEPTPKDDFETIAEYNQRIAVYESQVKQAVGVEILEKLKKEEVVMLAGAKDEYLLQQIRLLTPFAERLDTLQARKFTLPEGSIITVDLGAPDAENNRFPVHLRSKDKTWSVWWTYTDRNSAKEFYRTRTHLKAQGIFQMEEAANLGPKLTATKVTNTTTKESRDFILETPAIFGEIEQIAILKNEEQKNRGAIKESGEKEARLLARKEITRDGHFTVYDDGTVLDIKTNLMWAMKDNGEDISWIKAKSYCESYRAGGYMDWRMPSQNELTRLYDGSKSYKVIQRHYNVHLTEMIQLTASCPWASDVRDSEAAYFDFMHGKLFWTGQSYSKGYRALPVRANK